MAARRRVFIGLGGVFIVAGLIYAALWFIQYRYIQTTDNAYVQSDISVISPRVTGYLATVNIVENAYVHKDDVLAICFLAMLLTLPTVDKPQGMVSAKDAH